MRVAPLFVLAAALTFAASAQTASAQTQTTTGTAASSTATTTTKPVKKPKTRIEITKRSPLDAGTTVKPGSKSYLDYALPADYNFPTYGAGQNSVVPGRYPLADRWYLPGF